MNDRAQDSNQKAARATSSAPGSTPTLSGYNIAASAATRPGLMLSRPNESSEQCSSSTSRIRNLFLRAASVVVAALTLQGCGQDTAAPVAPLTDARALAAHTFDVPIVKTKVKGVKRNEALIAATTVRATIGLTGGVINAPGGLTVFVPPGAVWAPTSFAVTTVPGKLVAYEFEPHGQRFLVPLVMTQTTKGLDLKAGMGISILKAAHFGSVADLNQTEGTALVDELLGLRLSLPLGTMVFTVTHFSGYMVAW